MLTQLLLALAVATPAPPGPTPTPVTAPVAVAERVVTRGDLTTRLSLFSNRVAVLTVREDGRQTFVRRRTLTQEEYVGYLAELSHDGPLLRQEDIAPLREVGGDRTTLTLRVGTGPPHEVEYSPLLVSHLALSRLNAALDDLESVLRETSPSRAALESWQPARGDRVELWGGEIARVVEVRNDGVVILEHEDTPMIETLSADQLPQRIRRVLPRQP